MINLRIQNPFTGLKLQIILQDKARALAISGPCLRLFQHLFKYRQSDVVRSNDLSKSVEDVESHFIETFLTLMLKLSLDDFKPIFYRLFNLSYGGENITNKHMRNITRSGNDYRSRAKLYPLLF